MVDQLEPLDKLFAAGAVEPAGDLSDQISAQVAREPSDRVTCRRVYGDHYRCNWWSRSDASRQDNPGMSGPTVATHRVRVSAFLHVTKTSSGLTIREMSGSPALAAP